MRGKVTPRAKRRAEPEPCADSLLDLASPAEEFTESVITSTETHSTTIRSTSSCSAADVTCSPTGASQSSSNLPSATNPKPWLSAGVKPYYLDERAGIAIFLGDCREILPTLGKFDLLLTDPPYGVNLGEHAGAKERRSGLLVKGGGYVDTPENFTAVVVPSIGQALDCAVRGMVFCVPPSMWQLPAPVAIGGVFVPGAVGRNAWGWSNLIHCLLYGIAPGLEKGAKPTAISKTVAAEKTGHPTPKPEIWLRWALNLGSAPGHLVVDPFMGGGTMLRAAKDLNRRAIGIEIDERYCEIAAKRLAQEVLFA